jgi:beta-glucosidase
MPGYTAIPDTSTLNGGAILALNAGLDVELPWGLYYGQLESLLHTGAITQGQLDAATRRVLYEKYRFNADPATGLTGLGTPVSIYSDSRISCDQTHLALATKAALESMVLLKNDMGTLPISPAVKKVAVIGAAVPYTTNNGSPDMPTGGTVDFARDPRTGDLGSSRAFFDPAKAVGPFAGIQAAAPPGVTVVAGNTAADVPTDADVVVVVAGLTPQDEGEEYTLAADRSTNCINPNACLRLDAKQSSAAYQGLQDKLIQQVAQQAAASGKQMVVVLEGGSVIEMPWLSQIPALVMAWYPGQRGGEALADLLWGQVGGVSYNFGGKLPFTWGHEQQYGDPFDTTGGTTTFDYYVGYRYFDQNGITPVFPFGAGQSYTTFALSNVQLGCSSMAQGAVLPVYVNVTNTGMVPGDDTVMVFVSFPQTKARRSLKELKGFARVSLAAGEAKQVTIQVRLSDLDYFQTDSSTPTTGHWVVESGPIEIKVTDGRQNPADGTTVFLPTATVNVAGYMVGSPQ